MALIGSLSVAIGSNTAELRKGLNEAQNSVNKFGKNAKKSGNSVQSSFKGIGNKAKDMASQITGQMGMAGEAIESLGGAFTGMLNGLKGATGGLKIFKVALASTGIGLLIVSLTSLVTYFTQTQQGADWLSKTLGALGAVFDVVVDSVAEFGGAIFDAFANPKETVKGFGDSIGTFVMDKIKLLIKGIKGLGTAFTLLFEGEFKAAAKQAGNSLLDITKATSPVAWAMEGVKKAIGYVTEKYGEASDEAKRAYQLQEDAIALEKAKIAQKLKNSEMEIKLSELIRKSKDKDAYDEEQRAAFIAEALEVQKKLSSDKIKLAQEELRIKQESDKLANNMRSDDEETVNLQIEVNKLKKEGNDKTRELLNRQNEANNAVAAQAKIQAEINRLKAEEQQIMNDMASIPKIDTAISMKANVEGGEISTPKLPDVEVKSIDPVNMDIIPRIRADIFNEEFTSFSETLAESVQNIAGIINEVTNSIGSAFSAVMNKRNVELDNYYKKEKEAINSSSKSSREKAAAINKLDEDVSKKKAKLAKKQAKMDKASAIVGAITNGAVAVTKALTLGFPLGLIMAGVIGSMAAVQVSTIASTPLPTFQFGGIVEGQTSGDRNLIRANGGEMVLNKAQQANMFDVINRNIKPTGKAGGGQMIPEVRLKGEDIYIAFTEYNRKQNNTF